MKRRSAILGILSLTGIGIASYAGFNGIGGKNINRGDLKNYLTLLEEIVDVVIPKTETPGAKEANVHYYILDYMEACSSDKEYNNFIAGLMDLQDQCMDSFNIRFEFCQSQQKRDILEKMESTLDPNSLLVKIKNKIGGRSFFEILKSLTVEGYCSSEIGATKHLRYAPVPGRYREVIISANNPKAWATS